MSTLAQPEFLDMPRMKARLIVTALLALVTGTAAASDWQLVDINETAIFEMDVASLTRHGNIVRAWTRAVYSELQEPDGDRYWSSRTRYYFDCAERRVAVKQRTQFTDKEFNNVAFNGTSIEDALLRWNDLAPDTLGEGLLEFACSKAPK